MEIWPSLQKRFLDQDRTWKQECLKRDEKFEMHFSAAVCHILDTTLPPLGHDADFDRNHDRTVHIRHYRTAKLS